jgi:hypothetical protein
MSSHLFTGVCPHCSNNVVLLALTKLILWIGFVFSLMWARYIRIVDQSTNPVSIQPWRYHHSSSLYLLPRPERQHICTSNGENLALLNIYSHINTSLGCHHAVSIKITSVLLRADHHQNPGFNVLRSLGTVHILLPCKLFVFYTIHGASIPSLLRYPISAL